MTTASEHPDGQPAADGLILERLAEQLGASITPQRQYLEGDAFVDVDGVAADGSVLVEVFAHPGGLKGAQRQKLATKILKLITVAQGRDPRPRLILAVADPAITQWTAATNWHAGALATWEIEVFLVATDPAAPDGPADVRPVTLAP
jgi:hypothetical protein